MLLTTSKKRPLVFLPGWGFHASIWQPIADHFQGHAVHFADLPLIRDTGHTLERLCEKMNEKLSKGSILIAWSLGGLFAISLCALFPDKYTRLVLVASHPRFSAAENYPGISKSNEKLFLTDASSNLDLLTKKFHRLISLPNSSKSLLNHLKLHHFTDKTSLVFYLNLLFDTDLRNQYKKINIPILHLAGEKDAVLPSNPTYDTTLMPGGHAFFLSQTALFISHINEFIYD